MKVTRFSTFVMVLGWVAASGVASAQPPVGSAFTYQGQLSAEGKPVDDTCDFQFALYDASSGGGQVGSTVSTNGIEVVNGLFTVRLDFGDSAFAGNARWLEIAVKGSADPGFTTLSPRQELTPAPYAIHAQAAGSGWGGGTTDFIAKFASPTTLDDSVIHQDSDDGEVGINIAPASALLHIHRPSDGASQHNHLQLTNSATGTAAHNGIEMGFWSPNTQDAFLCNWESGFLSFCTSGADRMRILQDGKVGVGTTSAQNKLDVEGSMAVGAAYSGTYSAPANGMIIESKVGIGTNSPLGRLDLYTGTSETDSLYVRTSPSQAYGGIIHHQSSTYGWQETVTSTASLLQGTLRFHYVDRTAPGTKQRSDVLVLKADGDVGIGLWDTQATLDVDGKVRIRDFETSGADYDVQVQSDGDLVRVSSSKRYKKDVADLIALPQDVLRLRPVQFKWKETGQRGVGLIAEEVAETVRDLVVYDEQGRPDAVRYDKVALYLLMVLKDKDAEIATQRAQIADLTARLERIEALLGDPASAGTGGAR